MRLRYYFEHIFLRDLFFNNSTEVFESLCNGDKVTFIQKFLLGASRCGEDFDYGLIDFDVRSVEQDGTYKAIVLKMCDPESAPDCYEIVLVFDEFKNPLRYYTLESDSCAPDACFVCEWGSDGKHYSLADFDSTYNPGIVDQIFASFSMKPKAEEDADEELETAMGELVEYQLIKFFPDGLSQAKKAIDFMNCYFKCDNYKQALEIVMFYASRIQMGMNEERVASSATTRYDFITKETNSELYFFFKNEYFKSEESQPENNRLSENVLSFEEKLVRVQRYYIKAYYQLFDELKNSAYTGFSIYRVDICALLCVLADLAAMEAKADRRAIVQMIVSTYFDSCVPSMGTKLDDLLNKSTMDSLIKRSDFYGSVIRGRSVRPDATNYLDISDASLITRLGYALCGIMKNNKTIRDYDNEPLQLIDITNIEQGTAYLNTVNNVIAFLNEYYKTISDILTLQEPSVKPVQNNSQEPSTKPVQNNSKGTGSIRYETVNEDLEMQRMEYEAKQKEDKYWAAVQYLKKDSEYYDDIMNWRHSAISLLSQIGDYRDSYELIDKAKKEIRNAKEVKKGRHDGVFTGICFGIAVAAILFLILFVR